MNWLKRLFALYFDEVVPEDKPAEEPAAEDFKSLTDEEFSALSEEKQNEHLAASVAHNFEKAEKPAEEPAEEPTEEPAATPEEELAAEDNDNDDGASTPAEDSDDTDLEEIADPVIKKRLTDTQAAFRTARSENVELQKRVAELEKKATPAPVTPEKPGELTLATIKPEVLAKAMKEDPVNTLRWVADQQVKQSLALNKEAETKAAQEIADKNFVRTSEDNAVKKFPVLQEILALGNSPEKLAKLKETSKSKYEFGQKTAKYYKEFAARGDKEAFYNAAARAYVELSPQMIKDVQIETKRLAEQEQATKRRVLGKVSVTGNKGGISQKGAPKHKSLSEDEFMKLTPAQQVSHWGNDIDAKSAR